MNGEPFGFVAFRSRQQTTAFESALRRQGVGCRIINTPHEIGMGCGLSVRFDISDMNAVLLACDRTRPQAMIGVYSAEYVNGRLVCKPLSRTMRYCRN